MRRRRTAIALAMALVASTGWSTDSARAGVPGEAIVGDFNGDSRSDPVVLGAVSPNFCSTIVRYGTAPYAVGPGGLVSAVLVGDTAVPGPIQFCSVDTPTVQLADWNRSGVDGVLLSYTNGCADGSSGVVRIRGDGSIDPLEIDPTGQARWTIRVTDANGDRFPDVRTVNQVTGGVSYFVNSGQGGLSFLVRAPDANTDRVVLTSTKAVAIDVLGNDLVTRWATLVITTPPRYGTVQVLSDLRVLYRPDPRHGRTDRFTYQLGEEGRHSSATVYLRFPD